MKKWIINWKKEEINNEFKNEWMNNNINNFQNEGINNQLKNEEMNKNCKITEWIIFLQLFIFEFYNFTKILGQNIEISNKNYILFLCQRCCV